MTLAPAGRTAPAGSRRRVRRPRILIALAALVVAGLAACVVVYCFPPQQTPPRADVVMVIGPPDQWRIDLAEQLIDEHKADALLVSTSPPGPWITQPAVCSEILSVPVTCFHPVPFTTAGEVKELRAQMRAHHWTTATIITFTPHIARTRFIASRCIPSGVTVVGKPEVGDGEAISPPFWLYSFAYQTAGFVKALIIGPDC